MSQEDTPRRAVKVLKGPVARRIAAGEVIDRPASVVRELLDNAIDAGSTEISVYIEEGGVGRIRVVDNGCGMTQEDLQLCCLPHATSKIETEDDLYRVTTLGFRGEALSSIVTVARVEITSGTSEAACKIVIHGGEQLSFAPYRGNQGTIIDVADLFYAIPARRRFMKTASAETAQCRTTFLEKAAAFPGISFKFFTDGTLKVFLPAADLLSRISTAYSEVDKRMLYLQTGSGDGFQLSIAAAAPELSRRDRKYIHIYVNRRRIWEYALIQGVEYSYRNYLPGGVFPSCFVFAEIDPDRVDFNIHPAKKEAKIKNIAEVRRRVTDILDSFLRQLRHGCVTPPSGGMNAGCVYEPLPQSLVFADNAAPPGYQTRLPAYAKAPYGGMRSYGPQDLVLAEAAPSFTPETKYDFIYRGQVFGLFLIAEKAGNLYLVDQHAAHERIIYEELAGDTLAQPLLIPYEFETDEEEDAAVQNNAAQIAGLGIEVIRRGARKWVLAALPESYRGGEEDIIQAITTRYGAADSLKKKIFADIACKKAIKDGGAIDPLAACEIIRAAFALENPRCPHGRPLWFEISREDLMRKVGRLV
ncbi:MAG: DNA mismatch repair endonuclease MutL [Spirochaetales bacterium]|jgi:DNA mismatch repair protein MutL|nr:DNA mismatch repair endonuclease MutL [Spirochaetales bacterium]